MAIRCSRRDAFVGAISVAATMATSTRASLAASPSVFPLKHTRGERLLIDAKVNGNPVEALLDSGAEMSFLDRELAKKIGLTGNKLVTVKGSGKSNSETPIANGVTLETAGITLRNQTVAIADLSDVGRRLLGHPLPMIFGREIFDNARLRIDIRGRQLEVLAPNAVPRGVQLPLRTVNGIEVCPVRVEGEEVQACLDIGNGSNVLIGSRYAERRGLLRDGRPIATEKGGGIGGEHERKVIRLKSLEVAGLKLADVPASVDAGDSATDLNVGISVLRNFVITTDFAKRLLWLEPVR
jgi:predicted aspartyl protease